MTLYKNLYPQGKVVFFLGHPFRYKDRSLDYDYHFIYTNEERHKQMPKEMSLYYFTSISGKYYYKVHKKDITSEAITTNQKAKQFLDKEW